MAKKMVQVSETSPAIVSYVGGKETVVTPVQKITGEWRTSNRDAQASLEQAKAQAKAQAEKLAKAQAEQKAREEKARQEAIKAQQEATRIENLRRALVLKGAKEKEKISRDVRTGDKLRIIETKKGADLIRTTINLNTGQTRTNVYGTGKGGGGVRFKSGVQTYTSTQKDIQDLKNSGLKPILDRNGNIIAFSSPDTQRTYRYSNAGINAYNQDSQGGGVIFRKYIRDYKNQYGMSVADTSTPLTYKISYGSFYKNIDAKLRGILPKGVNRVQIQEAKKTAEELLKKGLPGKVTYSESKVGGKSYVIKFMKQKDGIVISLAKKTDKFISSKSKNIKNNVSNLLNRSGINVNNTAVGNYISRITSNLKSKGINTINKYRNFAESRRAEAEKNLEKYKINFKKPSTYTQALKWVRNFDRYITNRAIVTALDLGIATPQLINQLRAAPFATIAALPGAIKTGFIQDFQTIKSGNFIGITNLASDYLVYTAAFGLAGRGVKTTTQGIMRVLPGTKRLKAGQIIVRKATKTRPGLVLKSQTVSSGAKPLSFQARMAGKNVTAVTAQAERLTSLLRRKKIVRKPIPGEANFPMKIKRLLNKFDSGKRLTNKEFAEVNAWLRKNVASNITLLERSLYLDPASGLRISRLGIQESRTAELRDILRGNFKLWERRGRPQILVFENAKIAKFPKALKLIERKLKLGKELTEAETNKLIRWQVQTGSGRFKPIGSTIYAGGRELEITLAPGEMIKQVKRLGRIYIDGRKVSIVSAEVFKPSKIILRQIKLAEIGKLSKAGVEKLNKLLSKKLGRKIRVETPEISKRLLRKSTRRLDSNVPVLRVRGLGIAVVSRGIRQITRPVSNIRRVSRVATRNKTSIRNVRSRAINRRVGVRPITGRVIAPRHGTRAIRRSPSARAGRVIPGRNIRPSLRRGIGSGTNKPIIPLALKSFQQSKLSKPVQTYYVVEKVRGKFKKLYPKPLTAKDAKDYAVYSIDNRLSKTAFFVPLGRSKNVIRPPKAIQNYYSRNSQKVRPYRIRFGKRRQLVNGFIEKRKYFQDTAGERTQAGRLRLMSRVTKRRSIAKISPERRKQLIRQLVKARMVRMKNLKARK